MERIDHVSGAEGAARRWRVSILLFISLKCIQHPGGTIIRLGAKAYVGIIRRRALLQVQRQLVEHDLRRPAESHLDAALTTGYLPLDLTRESTEQTMQSPFFSSFCAKKCKGTGNRES